jgi:predicted esterase
VPKKLFQRTISETKVKGGRRVLFVFHEGGEEVPGILLLAERAPAPAALLLHGYSSRKEVMSESIGSALLQQGISSLSIDLPEHGERGSGQGMGRSAMELVKHWRTASREALLAIRYLSARKDIDRDHIAVVGYSLGSFLALALTPREDCIRAVVLAAGGDLPDDMPFGGFARTVIDPTKLVRKLDGRPLLMLHGKRDRTVKPAQAQRLFDAALEPKEIRWYDSGHILPPAAGAEAARWLAGHLR